MTNSINEADTPPIEDKGGLGFIVKRRFAPLFILLQSGTFNDSALKNALIALITFGGIAFLSDLPSAIRVPVATLIFTGPFTLICPIAGQISDKFDRGIVLRWVKRFEILIMCIAALGFWLVDVRILALALGLMGAQSGFFSPTKNAVLPQWLTPKELIRGNALLNGFVFVMVLVGQVVATYLVLTEGGPKMVAGMLLIFALIGWIASEFCPPAPAPTPELKINFEPISATFTALSHALKAPTVLRPMLGIAWFYGLSTVFVTTFPDYVATVMGYDFSVLIVILVLSTLSILLGSLIVMFVGNMKIWGPEAVRLSALGITGVMIFIGLVYLLPSPTHNGDRLGTAADFLANPHTPAFLGAVLLSSVCNGLFVVPLQAMAQRRADPKIRARLMSAGAVLLNLFVNITTFGLIGLALLRLPPKSPFLMVIVGSAIVAAYAIYRSVKPVEHKIYVS
ncbi:MFS transporter [Litorimonas taeanensis]|uniref:MFS transporter n=1 Tax=Litorimonas taeanensis TaxID=568099 RepID=A0A420WEZ1_9PROT|nr:MFS transporter [Litorimonas taeanensis]RKQ69554.1 MFS transporter [Litorimonas taeanensis]